MDSLEKYNNIVISLTTIDSRIENLEKTIESILDNTLLPNYIRIYYSNEPFLLDNGINDDKLINLKKKIDDLNINNVDIQFKKVPNIGSYRKLIYCLKEFANHIIITIDDDIIYEPTFINKYIEEYRKYKCIICSMARYIENINNFKKLSIFRYKKITEDCYNLNILPEGLGGILYHTNMFSDDIKNFDYKKLDEILIKNDDLFFRKYTYDKGIMVCVKLIPHKSTTDTKSIGLFNNYNKFQKLNNVLEHYPF